MVRTRRASSARNKGALESMHHVTLGPDDMVVLYLQDQHRSEDIWSGQVTRPVLYYLILNGLYFIYQ